CTTEPLSISCGGVWPACFGLRMTRIGVPGGVRIMGVSFRPEVIMPRILIADDNQANAELLEAHLDGTGYDTRIASNGEDTLTAARDWKPDVILLDVMMPKLSGFEVCQRLRAAPATK